MYSAPFIVRGPSLELANPTSSVGAAPRRVADPAGVDLRRREAGFWGESAGVVFETSPRHGRDLISIAMEGQPPPVSFGPALLGYPRGTFLEVPNVRHRGTL